MSFETLTDLEAWTRITRSAGARWEEASKRLRDGPVPILMHPTFLIDRSSRFFCIGSCFARNIEEHLLYRGIPVLSKRLRSPNEVRDARPNRAVNKFTTHSMLQELRWLRDPPADPAELLVQHESGWLDMQLAPGVPPTTLEHALDRRAYLSGDYFARITKADIVVLTLGLNEVWRDVAHDVWWNAPPRFQSVRRQPGRCELHITDVADNVSALNEFHEILSAINPGARIIVTVSPVPMGATFSGTDILVANARSKCTLRAAAETFCRSHENVGYFPSFEMVTLANHDKTYAPDHLHVLDGAVRRIVGTFINGYIGDIEPLDPDYVEMLYLAANPDVDAKVRSGQLESGLEHWLSEGRPSGRPIRPQVINDQLLMLGMDGPSGL